MPSPDYRFAVGTFGRQLGSGNQVVSGIADGAGAFTPKAVILFTTCQNSEGFTSDGLYSFGFSDGAAMRAISTFKKNNITGDAITGRHTRSYVTNLTCLATCNETQTVIDNTAAVTVFGLGSFTIDWLATTGAPWTVHYLAIGGDDVSAKVLSVVQPASPSTQIVTGLGIGPITGLILLPLCGIVEGSYGVATVALDDHPTLAWADGTHQGACHAATASFANQPTVTSHLQRSNLAITTQLEQSPSPAVLASIASLDADGFTITWTQMTNRQDLTPGLYCLALSGPTLAAGTIRQSDATLALPFVPAALFLASVGYTPSSATAPECRWSFGAVDAQGHRGAVWMADANGVNTTTAARADHTDLMIVSAVPNLTPGSSTIDATVVPTLTGTGATFTWPTDDSGGRELLYLAFEGAPFTPPPPPTPGTSGCAGDFPSEGAG